MARNPLRDRKKLSSNAPRVGVGEPGAAAATRRVEGAPATAAAYGVGPDLLGSAVEGVDELAAFAARGTAGNGGRLAPGGIQTLLGVEESAARSAEDSGRAPRSDSADEPRQSPVGCTENPRRTTEARPSDLAGDGVEIHDPASEAAVTGMANILEEPRRRCDRVGFLHGADRDLSSTVRARDADAQPTQAGAFQCHRAPNGGMDGTTTDRGVRAGGRASVSDSGPRPSLWRTIFASGPDVGHPGGGHCATLAVAKRLRRARDWLASAGMCRP